MWNERPSLPGKVTSIYFLLPLEDVEGIEVKRKLKYCMEVLYDGKVTPHAVIPAFLAFNKANRLIKVNGTPY